MVEQTLKLVYILCTVQFLMVNVCLFHVCGKLVFLFVRNKRAMMSCGNYVVKAMNFVVKLQVSSMKGIRERNIADRS